MPIIFFRRQTIGVSKKAIKAVNKSIAEIIEVRHKSKLGENDLLSVLLSMNVDNSDKQIRDEIVTFFTAAHETTAIALTWAWVLLAQNSEAAQKMAIEIKQLGGNKLSFSDLSKLAFTSQILKESLRLFPPNRSVAREVTKHVKVKNFNVPKGSQIVMSQWVLHRDSRFFDSPDKIRSRKMDSGI